MEAGETPRPSGPEGASVPTGPGRSAIYSVELEVFEGPLDLLLHLVRRHELEILDIPIAFITEKYLEYLDFMRSLDLEVAGDYLVMAATLAWLKSRELLPTLAAPAEAGGEDDDDGEDPREALIRRLVEYERFKNAAADLDALPVSGRDVFARGGDIDIPPIDPGLAPVTLFKLAEAYYRVLTRAKISKSHEVQLEPVTVAQRMTQLTLMLDKQQAFDFEGLFLGRTWSSERELRTMLVVTLMSVLELVKLGVARVQQVADSDSIRIYRLSVSDEARALIDAYDEEQSFGDDGKPRPPPPPMPTEAELDEAEESALLAEALAGADDTDLGPDAGAAPAANEPAPEPTEASADEVPAGADADVDADDADESTEANAEDADDEPSAADRSASTEASADEDDSTSTEASSEDEHASAETSVAPNTAEDEPESTSTTDDDDSVEPSLPGDHEALDEPRPATPATPATPPDDLAAHTEREQPAATTTDMITADESAPPAEPESPADATTAPASDVEPAQEDEA